MFEHDFNVQSWVGNGISLGAIAISFAGYIPAIAAAVALVWYLIQIYESATVRTWLRQRKFRKILRLRARLATLVSQEDAEAPTSTLDQFDA